MNGSSDHPLNGWSRNLAVQGGLINVAADSDERCEFGEFIENTEPSNITAMENQIGLLASNESVGVLMWL